MSFRPMGMLFCQHPDQGDKGVQMQPLQGPGSPLVRSSLATAFLPLTRAQTQLFAVSFTLKGQREPDWCRALDTSSRAFLTGQFL